ncbi:hypothetical protein RMR21_008525 [Agrobacterium sp. rho-8.1]|nr:hypothetical protein [Agrobacterium sp. rho-8.1]
MGRGTGFGPAGAPRQMFGPDRHACLEYPDGFRDPGTAAPVRPPPGVPTAHRLLVERDREECEAKVRRYTGKRCICPVSSKGEKGQMWPNWQVGRFGNEALCCPEVKGWTLNMSDR